MTRPLDAPVNLISHWAAKCTTNESAEEGAHSGHPEGCKQHTVNAMTFRILPQSLSRFVKEGIMKTDWRARSKRHSLPGHLMKTCLARRRLLDDHQLARFDQVPRGDALQSECACQ